MVREASKAPAWCTTRAMTSTTTTSPWAPPIGCCWCSGFWWPVELLEPGSSSSTGHQNPLHQQHPIGGAHGDVVVVEVIARVVHHAGALLASLTIANQQIAAWHALQHEGKVFAARQGRRLQRDMFRAQQLQRDLAREVRLLGRVDQHGIAGSPLELRLHAEALGLRTHQIANALLQQPAHIDRKSVV